MTEKKNNGEEMISVSVPDTRTRAASSEPPRATELLAAGDGVQVGDSARFHALRFLFYMHTLLPEAPRAVAIAAAAPAAHQPPLVPRNVSHERANI